MIFPLVKILKYDTGKQYEKIREEVKEFFDEDQHSDGEISEALDIIQSVLTYITHEYTTQEIESAVGKHYRKIYNRKHNIDKFLRILVEKHEYIG